MPHIDYKTLYENLLLALQNHHRKKVAADRESSQNFLEFIDADEKGNMPDWLKALTRES